LDAATTHRRWGYLGCCCAAVALSGCPQLLSDEFLLGRDRQPPDAGASAAAGATGQREQARAAGAGGTDPADAAAGDPGDAQSLASSCNDGVRNQDETGVDCGGGVCSPCNCQFGPFHDIVQVEGIGADDRFGPILSADGTRLYYSVQPSGGVEDIFRAVRSGTGTVFKNPEALASINGSSLDGSPFLSHDDRTLLFFSDRAGGLGNRDLWMATRASASEDFSAPEFLSGVNSAAVEQMPRLSYDGLTLLFESTRAGGSGSSDIWAAERPTSSGPFGLARPRADLNTSAREEGFSLSGDQLTIVLSSNRGVDSMDLWLATRTDPHADFGPLVPLTELNGSEDELDPGLSLTGREIFFTTTRDGDARIYHALRSCQ
jgi:WD40-like Beta Propeller Repeat